MGEGLHNIPPKVHSLFLHFSRSFETSLAYSLGLFDKFLKYFQQTLTCSMSTRETLEKVVKYVQS